jgi:hypothetical protein
MPEVLYVEICCLLLTLIVQGEVKTDLANFDIKFPTKP